MLAPRTTRTSQCAEATDTIRSLPPSSLRPVLAVALLDGRSCGVRRFAVPDPAAPGVLVAAAPAYPAESFVGRWGLASYHRDTDKVRTEKVAQQACGNAYVIKAGPNGGLMMYLADDPEMRELKVKGAAGGRTFIGPDGPPGGEWDREVVSFDGISSRNGSTRSSPAATGRW